MPTSPLTPDEVPSWCKDKDVNCGAYGTAICETSEVSICAAYCGCPSETTTDREGGAADTTGGSSDTAASKGDGSGAGAGAGSNATTTVIVVVVVILLLVIVGAVAYVKLAPRGGGDSTEEGIVAFDNPAYSSSNVIAEQQEPAYAAPYVPHNTSGGGASSSAGYMDVGGGQQQQQAASSGYMDVSGSDTAGGGDLGGREGGRGVLHDTAAVSQR